MENLFDIDIPTRKRARRNLLLLLRRDHGSDYLDLRRSISPLGEWLGFIDNDDVSSLPINSWKPLTYDSTLAEAFVTNPYVEAVSDYAMVRLERHTDALARRILTTYALTTEIRWLKYAVKGGTKFVPILGYGLLVYDLYNLGKDLEAI